MRIQYLSSSGELGGAEVCLLDMMASLRREQPQWQLALIAAQDGPLLQRAAGIGVDAKVLPFPPALARLGDSKPLTGRMARALSVAKLAAGSYAAANYSRRLRRCINEFAPDVLHSNSLKMNVLGVWASRKRVPMVWHLHDYVSSRPIMSKAMRFFRRRCAAMLANSDSVRDDARSALANHPGIHTLYNAIDTQEFAPEGTRVDLDRLCDLQPPAQPIIRVGLLATMAWWKGHKDFIRALALLRDHPAIRGYVIGGPLYHSEGSQVALEELRQFAKELHAQAQIGFTGFINRPATAMRSLDIVVHASTRPEPFGRVIVEAMACSRPIITTAVGGAAELINAGYNALTFRMGDPADLAQRITQLAANPELRNQLGAAGRKTAVERFDRQCLGNRLAGFYRQALESAS
jgi:glycosyltransferase involved in cell wall biosynthesis